MEEKLAQFPPAVRNHMREVLLQHELNDQLNPNVALPAWTGNPAASDEERRAAGHPTEI